MTRCRVGIGYDVHSLAEGVPLVIGGVNIPWPRGLAGHSDGDVMVHAIMDALLGAAALGDIGLHFPDSDSRYKGCYSLDLLAEANKILTAAGYMVNNVDCTLVAQEPKIKAYSAEMKENISRVLTVEPNKINIKASTTEHLGFVGRLEGMSCYAVCTIYPMDD